MIAKNIQRKLNEWREHNLISQESYESLVQYEENKPSQDKIWIGFFLLGLIAVFLSMSGYFYHTWKELDALYKFFIHLCFLLSVFPLSYLFRSKQNIVGYLVGFYSILFGLSALFWEYLHYLPKVLEGEENVFFFGFLLSILLLPILWIRREPYLHNIIHLMINFYVILFSTTVTHDIFWTLYSVGFPILYLVGGYWFEKNRETIPEIQEIWYGWANSFFIGQSILWGLEKNQNWIPQIWIPILVLFFGIAFFRFKEIRMGGFSLPLIFTIYSFYIIFTYIMSISPTNHYQGFAFFLLINLPILDVFAQQRKKLAFDILILVIIVKVFLLYFQIFGGFTSFGMLVMGLGFFAFSYGYYQWRKILFSNKG